MLRMLAVATLIAGLGVCANAQAQSSPPAQPSPIKRTLLQKLDVPGTDYETVIGIAEIIGNVNIGRHTHPGVEAGYVLEGELTLLVEGQQPLPLKAGQSYQIPAGAIHDARSGASGAKVIATYVVQKGKPLATPAP